MSSIIEGIAGMEGRLSVGAALTVGVKGDRGFPTERDRFHIVWPQEDEGGRRPYHPRFNSFNTADPKHRRAVFGVIANAKSAECFSYNLRCQAPKGHPSPGTRRPFCTGDGVKALRYAGADAAGVESFKEIVCPHAACEFRQGEPAACKPHMRFLFMLAWGEKANLPSMLCKFTSGSWNTIAGFVGFFKQIESTAASFGLAPGAVNLAGLRFALQLTERSNKLKKSRYPVVTITLLDDIGDFLQQQTRRAIEISGRRPVAALTDRDQQDPTVQHTDWAAHENTAPEGEE